MKTWAFLAITLFLTSIAFAQDPDNENASEYVIAHSNEILAEINKSFNSSKTSIKSTVSLTDIKWKKLQTENYSVSGSLDTPNSDYSFSGTANKTSAVKIAVPGCNEYYVIANTVPFKNNLGPFGDFEYGNNLILNVYDAITSQQIPETTVTIQINRYLHLARN